MPLKKFISVAAYESNPKWPDLIMREQPIYKRDNEIRSDFSRDYNRILHSTAYRRLKHKTQVFFATANDHVCTRIEHVNHVSSVSYTIAHELGLNTELTSAIAIGHDLGHAPFGHEGETIIKNLGKERIPDAFWHERNSLWFVDKLETLPDPSGWEDNLNLSYGVRDGIVCHCGEVNENAIYPRVQAIPLSDITKPNLYSSFSWEGCVVKIADKISYLGRDIEDALTLQFLNRRQLFELSKILTKKTNIALREINNTVLMHHFILDLCDSSSPVAGIAFSKDYLEIINSLKEFNCEKIYLHKRLNNFRKYARLIIESIFYFLEDAYKGQKTILNLSRCVNDFPILTRAFTMWLTKYSDANLEAKKQERFKNTTVYYISDKANYHRAILDFISGMTDNFAIKVFEELIQL